MMSTADTVECAMYWKASQSSRVFFLPCLLYFSVQCGQAVALISRSSRFSLRPLPRCSFFFCLTRISAGIDVPDCAGSTARSVGQGASTKEACVRSCNKSGKWFQHCCSLILGCCSSKNLSAFILENLHACTRIRDRRCWFVGSHMKSMLEETRMQVGTSRFQYLGHSKIKLTLSNWSDYNIYSIFCGRCNRVTKEYYYIRGISTRCSRA